MTTSGPPHYRAFRVVLALAAIAGLILPLWWILLFAQGLL